MLELQRVQRLLHCGPAASASRAAVAPDAPAFPAVAAVASVASVPTAVASTTKATAFSTATFSQDLVSIDYPDSRIEFNVGTESDDGPSEHVPGWFFSNLAFVPLRVNGDYEGLFLIDTGAVTSVLSLTVAAALGVTEDTPGAAVSLGLAGIDGGSGLTLTVPAVTLSTPESQASFPLMIAIDMDAISKALGIEVAGVVGYDFLKDYRVGIDFGNAEVIFSR